MKDIQTHLDKIRSDAAECLLLSSLVPDGKREVFAKTGQHLNALASELEKTIATNGADKGTRGDSEHMSPAGAREEAVAMDVAAVHQATRPRRTLTWLLLVVGLGAVVGTFFWANNPAREFWSFSSLRSKQETSPTAQDEMKQAIVSLLSREQGERKILMEQLGGLAARVDNLARAVDNLRTAHVEIGGPSNKESIGAEEKPPAVETAPSAPKEKPVRKDENRASTLENPAEPRQSDGVPSATDSPHIEPVDRVGAIPLSPRRSELDPHKPTIGPPGCTQFRSFDPVTGTYVTLEGRRRQCR